MKRCAIRVGLPTPPTRNFPYPPMLLPPSHKMHPFACGAQKRKNLTIGTVGFGPFAIHLLCRIGVPKCKCESLAERTVFYRVRTCRIPVVEFSQGKPARRAGRDALCTQ